MSIHFTPAQPWARNVPLEAHQLPSPIRSDLFNTSATGLSFSALSGGTTATTSPDISGDRVGILTFVDSTTAGGGYSIGSNSTPMALAGKEVFEALIEWLDIRSTTFGVVGFRGGVGATEPTNGAYCLLTGNATGAVLQGATSKDGVRVYTPTNFQVLSGVWYRIRVELNADATAVTYSLFNSPHALNAPPVWTQTLSTNIPTVGNNLGFGLYAYNTNTDAGSPMCSVDWLQFSCDRLLNR
jgi:hypothetical protein